MRPRSKNKLLLVAFQRGQHAYKIGLPVTACPFVAEPFYQGGWQRGWEEARRKDKLRMRKTVRELQSMKGE